jgi:peptidoglycan hydrolase-like protein with peptidoglycan-binding domain
VGLGVLLASLTLASGGAFAAAGHTGGAVAGSSAAVHAAGSTVASLQGALGLTPDGVYGPQTRRAVRAFQRAHGLVVDGIAGPQTLGALGLAAQSTRTLKTSRVGGGSATLARIAQCESGGNPAAISASGKFRGKYQFSRATWRAMGGSGDPAAAPEAEQDRIALALYQARGTAPWPVCGSR